MTLKEGHWILVFKRSIVQNKEKSIISLGKKEKKTDFKLLKHCKANGMSVFYDPKKL